MKVHWLVGAAGAAAMLAATACAAQTPPGPGPGGRGGPDGPRAFGGMRGLGGPGFMPGGRDAGAGRLGLMVLRAADANDDKSIERSEFDDLARAEFAYRDRNGDGVLDEHDLSPVVQRMAALRDADPDRPPRDDRPERRGERADTDDNGSISEAEYLAAEARMFERLDANSDGVITPDELDAQADARADARRNRGRWWRAQ